MSDNWKNNDSVFYFDSILQYKFSRYHRNYNRWEFFIEHDIICGNLSRSKLLPKIVNAYVKINVYCEINLSNRFCIVIIMFDCFSFILIYVRSYSFVFVRSH